METIEIHEKIAKIVIAFLSTYETPPRSRSIDDRTRMVRAIVGSYEGTEMDGDFRFTRVWAISSTGSLQIIAGHVGMVAT